MKPLLVLFLVSVLAFAQAIGVPRIGPGALPPAPGAPKPEAPKYKPDELCTIEGVVRNAVTGEPLKKATIMLYKVDPRNPGSPSTTSTNPEGKFAMKAIEPGQYRLSVDRPGFVRTEYGAKPGSMQGGTVLTFDKGQSIGDITFQMSPHSVITGRILDDEGDPVQGAQVQLLRHRFWQGRRQLMPMSYASTNDLGEYRMFGIAPGKYYLSVNAAGFRMAGGVDRSANPQPDESYAPTYYPGVNDIAAASPINVGLGRTIQGVDATLRKTRTYRVRGTVSGVTLGNRGGMVTLRSKDASGEMLVFSSERNMSNFRGPGGEFEFRGVRPGSYLVQAMHSESQDQLFNGRATVEVTDRDIEGVTMTLVPGIDVRGSVRVEGETPVNFADLSIYLEPKVSGPMMGMTSARVKEDGSFAIPRVSADLFSIRINAAPPEFYLKSARLGDVDVLEHGLDLERSNSASGLDVVLSPGAAAVEGSVSDNKDNPVKGAAVLLRPKDAKPSMLPLLQKYVSTDQNGRFKIQGIVPGAYSLIAFDGVDLMEAQDPDVFQQHQNEAVKLELPANGRETRAMKAISLSDTSR